MKHKQTQKAGDGSTNIQAEKVIISRGVTYSEAREIALAVFKNNFLELQDQAAKIAQERAEDITDKFLKRLQNENPKAISQSKDPDFQCSLFTIQKEYARSGDKDLSDLLVDILVERAKEENRNIKQIVLNESLQVAPKLVSDHLVALSLIFLLRYTVNSGIRDLKALEQYLDKYILPFVSLLTMKPTCYQHLEYTGCGSISSFTTFLSKIFIQSYQGLFSKGFILDALKSRGIDIPIEHQLFTKCLHDPTKYQINFGRIEEIEPNANKTGIHKNQISNILDLVKDNTMPDEEVREYIISVKPYMSELFEVWDKSFMGRISLTSVGIAIAHANIERKFSEKLDLSIWVN